MVQVIVDSRGYTFRNGGELFFLSFDSKKGKVETRDKERKREKERKDKKEGKERMKEKEGRVGTETEEN